MPHFASLIFVAFMAVGLNANAQTSPPVRPGLWEITAEHSVDGKRPMSVSEQLANATPSQRAWAERLTDRAGDSKSTANVSLACFTSETLANARWHGVTPKCTTRYSVQDSSRWKWHSTCQQNEIDGEALFNGPESYRTNTVSMLNGNGTTHVVTVNATMRWLGHSCDGIR